MIQRTDQLPDVNGVSATVVIHLDDHAWRTGRGTAVTSHGAIIPAGEAIRWAGGDARVMTVALNSMREVTATSGLHRIFTESQRLALAARDVGCTFPGCTAPPARCQAHHLTDWVNGGLTTIDNGALVCAHDHRERLRQGWTSQLIHGRVAWTPPAWLDPDQKPRYNNAHAPARL